MKEKNGHLLLLVRNPRFGAIKYHFILMFRCIHIEKKKLRVSQFCTFYKRVILWDTIMLSAIHFTTILINLTYQRLISLVRYNTEHLKVLFIIMLYKIC